MTAVVTAVVRMERLKFGLLVCISKQRRKYAVDATVFTNVCEVTGATILMFVFCSPGLSLLQSRLEKDPNARKPVAPQIAVHH